MFKALFLEKENQPFSARIAALGDNQLPAMAVPVRGRTVVRRLRRWR